MGGPGSRRCESDRQGYQGSPEIAEDLEKGGQTLTGSWKDLVSILEKKDLTISFAESCTGGHISSKITNVPGSSIVFLGGIISYSNELKMELLSVCEDTIQTHGAVSRETAGEMVKGVMNLTGSDIAVSVTGIAGPDGGTPEKPVGTVYIGFLRNGGVPEIRRSLFEDISRAEFKEMVSRRVLDVILKHL